MPDLNILIFISAIAASAMASITGFGIGSILTPILAMSIGTKLAVSAICIPHLTATAFRCWVLRTHIDKKVLLNFGITSAAGGFAGAMLHAQAQSHLLTIVFGILLIVVSVLGITGYDSKLKFGRKRSGAVGALSGLLGGMVGNQGGLRSAAMLSFNMPKESFVGTATAIGVIVDSARLPVYLATEFKELAQIYPLIAWATFGTMTGTLLGMTLLSRVPQKAFKRVVSFLLLLLGLKVLFTFSS